MFSFMSLHAQWDQVIIQNPGAENFLQVFMAMPTIAQMLVTSTFAANFLQGSYIEDNLKQQVVSNFQTGEQTGIFIKHRNNRSIV